MKGFGAVVVLAAAILSAEQVPAPAPQETRQTVIRVGVDLVRIDATVTDRGGRHVVDLTPADFEILQDGKPQSISTFAYVAAGTGARPGETGAAGPILASPPASGSGTSSRPSPDRVRRTIAMVVDDLGLSFESTYHVHRTLKNFIDTQVQPGDLVAVLRTGAGVGALQQFTTDRRLLYAAVDRIRWNMNARVVPFETATSAADAKISAHEAEIFTAGTLGAVRYVLKGVAELPGRKAIVLFSDGFKLTDADNHYGRVLGTLRSLVDAANRAGVVIYSVHAAGLQTGAPSAAEGSPGNPGQRLDMIRAAQDGLAVLAQQTGGLFIHDTNDLAGGVRRVLDDQQGYYLLGYVPDRSTFSESTPRFHSLRVRVRRPDLRVRSRSGFLGQPDTTPKARTVADRMIAAVTSPFAGGEINLRLTSFFGQVDKVGPVVQSYMHIDAKELTFEERADGTRDAQVEVLAVTFGENGEVADQSSRRYTVTLLPDRYAEALKTGFVYTVRVPVKRPGPYQLRIALRDVKSDRIGSTSHFVDVPDVRKGRLTLSGLLIEGARPRSAGGEAADHVEAADPNASVAVRSFRQGADANYACYVYNAKRGPSGRPQLESEVRLFRDGVQVFHSPARPLSPVPDASSAMAGGLLRFGSAFPPGTYVLELTVIDRLAKKNSRATQTIDFEVVP